MVSHHTSVLQGRMLSTGIGYCRKVEVISPDDVIRERIQYHYIHINYVSHYCDIRYPRLGFLNSMIQVNGEYSYIRCSCINIKYYSWKIQYSVQSIRFQINRNSFLFANGRYKKPIIGSFMIFGILVCLSEFSFIF